MIADDVLRRLRRKGSRANVAGMARFGIRPKTEVLGISMWALRPLAREIGKDHALARRLWASRIHEARMLAAFIDDPQQVTEAQGRPLGEGLRLLGHLRSGR